MEFEFLNLENINEEMTGLVDKLIEPYPEFDQVDVTFFHHRYSYGIIGIKLYREESPEDFKTIERAYFSICKN